MERVDKKLSVEKGKSKKENKNTKDTKEICKSWKNLNYDVLCIIFKYLNQFDLSSASQVCRSWFDIAKHEKKNRGPSCFIRRANDFKYVTNSCNNYNKEIINCLKIKTSLSLSFVCGEETSYLRGCHGNYLPPNCDLIMLNVYGTVINNEEDEVDKKKIVCMLLHEVPGIKISTYFFKNKYEGINNLNKLKHIFRYSQDFHRASCLILLCDWEGHDIALNLMKYLKDCITKVSIWGGIGKRLSYCTFENNIRVCKEKTHCVAIAISGSGMETFSILVDKKCDTKEKVKNKLKVFKDSVQLMKHSIGFMFSCCVRGRTMYGEPDVESTIFKELFPEVPLIGCFGDGEFGENIVKGKDKIESIKGYNTVSTSFMILTYN